MNDPSKRENETAKPIAWRSYGWDAKLTRKHPQLEQRCSPFGSKDGR